MQHEKIVELIFILNKFYGNRLLVGESLFNEMKFISECVRFDNIGEDSIIILGGSHPLANKVVKIDDIISLDQYISKIESFSTAFTDAQDENFITILTETGTEETTNYFKIVKRVCEKLNK